jgi:peptide chain release factor subunit 1
LKLDDERKVLAQFNKEMALNLNKVCYGVADTMELLDMGAVKTLIVSKSLKMRRIGLKNPKTKETTFKYFTPEEVEQKKRNNDGELKFKDASGKIPLKAISNDDLLEWLIEYGAEFVTSSFLVSDKSAEGHTFVHGFAGIGGILYHEICLN